MSYTPSLTEATETRLDRSRSLHPEISLRYGNRPMDRQKLSAICPRFQFGNGSIVVKIPVETPPHTPIQKDSRLGQALLNGSGTPDMEPLVKHMACKARCALVPEFRKSILYKRIPKSWTTPNRACTPNMPPPSLRLPYPRSPETIEACLSSRESFESAIWGCLDWDFDNYYCVSKLESRQMRHNFWRSWADFHYRSKKNFRMKRSIDRSKVSLCLKVKEGVYDILKLRELVKKRMEKNDRIQDFSQS